MEDQSSNSWPVKGLSVGIAREIYFRRERRTNPLGAHFDRRSHPNKSSARPLWRATRKKYKKYSDVQG